MMKVLLFLLLAQDINFAKQLESEGDYFRAIYEYKRIYYESDDYVLKDSVASKIAFLSLKIGDYNEALNYSKNISSEADRNIDMGYVCLLMGEYHMAEEFWKGNDTLLAWLYLRQGMPEKTKVCFPEVVFQRKSPFLSGAFSLLLPGAGKVYSGRAFDGVFSFLINSSTLYSAYRAFKSNRDLEFYLFTALGVVFYSGDIYGSVIAAKEQNEKELERLAREFELEHDVWKYWR